MHQNILNLVRLLDLDTDAHTVHARLDQDSLIFVSGNYERSEEDLRRGLRFDFWDVVPLGGLGCEVGEAEGGCQRGADALQVGT